MRIMLDTSLGIYCQVKNQLPFASLKDTNNYWYTGTEVLEGDIIQNSNEKYNNMVSSKYWTKTDPKDAKTLALTTCFSGLEKTKLLSLKYLKEEELTEPRPTPAIK